MERNGLGHTQGCAETNRAYFNNSDVIDPLVMSYPVPEKGNCSLCDIFHHRNENESRPFWGSVPSYLHIHARLKVFESDEYNPF